MSETIYIKHHWKIKNVIVGYRYYRRSLSSYRIINIIYTIIGIISLISGLYSLIVHSDIESLFSIAFGLLILSLNRISLLFFIHKCRKLNYENKHIEWEINKDVIIYRMINLFESSLSWDLVKGVLDTPEGFLIYPKQSAYYWLPKNAFNNQEDIAHFAFISQDKVKNWQQIK